MVIDADREVRYRATIALGKLGDPRAVEPLISTLSDTDYLVWHSAANARLAIGTLEALVGTLVSNDYSIRSSAVDALYKIDTPEAREAVRAWVRQKRGQ